MPVPLPPLRDQLLLVNGVNLRVRTAGVEDAPAIVLLHGFPDFWYGWRHQIKPLFDAGWRVIVPDLRGYGGSDKPVGPNAYHRDAFTADIVGLLDQLGVQRATIVGHDLGGLVGWWLGEKHSNRVDRLVLIGAPHPSAVAGRFASVPQVGAGWLPLLMKAPMLAEWTLELGNFAPLENTMARRLRKNGLDEHDLALYREAWGRENGLTAMLDGFRAWGRNPVGTQAVDVPTLLLWGDKDDVFPKSMADASSKRGAAMAIRTIPDAGHWPHVDQPDATNAAILEFVGRHEFQKSWRPRQW